MINEHGGKKNAKTKYCKQKDPTTTYEQIEIEIKQRHQQ